MQNNIFKYFDNNLYFRSIEDYPIKTKRKNLLYILHKEFGKDVNLISSIQKHPYWKYVSLLSISMSIQYLKERYLIEDIYKNIHIILYPR